MAQIVVAVASAVIAHNFGTIPGMIAMAVGNMLVSSMQDGPRIEGPRLSDMKVQASTEGAAIPQTWGTWRLAGNVIWSAGIVETRHEEEVGGKGGPSATQVSYTYSCSFAVGLCEGEIAGIRRVWADGKLLADFSEAASTESLFASSRTNSRIYTGSETQQPDPLIQAHIGAADTPAYRGLAYLVFENMQLADFGNRIPNITAEVVSFAATPTPHKLVETVISSPTISFSGSPIVDNEILRFVEFSIVGLDRHVNGRLIDTSGAIFSDGSSVSTGPSASGGLIAAEFGGDRCARVNGSTGESIEWYDHTGKIGGTVPAGVIFASGAQYHNPRTAQVFFTDTTSGTWYSIRFGAVSLTAIRPGPATWNAMFFGTDGSNYGVNLFTGQIYAVDDGLNVIDGPWTSDTTTLNVPIARDGNDWYWKNSTGVGSHQIRRWRVPSGYNLSIGTVAIYTCPSTRNIIKSILCQPGLVWVWERLTGAPNTNYTGYVSFAGELAIDTISVSSIVQSLCERAGMLITDIDVASISAKTVRGYARGRPMSVRQAIEPLQAWHQFDAVESGGVLKFAPRGGAPVATVSADDLVGEDGIRVQTVRAQEVELPSEIDIGFADVDRDHQPGVARARRLVTQSRQITSMELPVLASSAEAHQRADILLRDAWRSRQSYQFGLLPKWLSLDPADPIVIPVGGQAHTVRLTRIMAGIPGGLRCEAVSESQSGYSSTAAGTDAGLWTPSVVALDGPTASAVLDLPPLRDADNGAYGYLAAAGYLSGWRGALAYKSSDGGATYGQVDALITPAAIGTCTTTLAAGRADIFDEANTVTVRLTNSAAALVSASEASVLAGANACAIGDHGRWEVIQYKSAAQNVDGTWTLSGLLRGRKGTEHAIATHAVSDRFVALSAAALRRFDIATADIGAARQWKLASIGQALEAVSAQAITLAGVSLKPFAPVLLGGGRNTAGDVTITWVRRARVDHEWRDYVDVPLGEATESYEVEVWTAGYGTLKRTITGLLISTTTYTSAQQVTDFGGNQASVAVRVYQISATVGKGYPLQGNV